MGAYQAKHIIEVVGINQELLSQWLGWGYVIPDTPAEGAGTRNWYKISTVCQIYLFNELISVGKFSRKKASEFAFAPEVKTLFEIAIASEKVKKALHPRYEGTNPPFSKAFTNPPFSVAFIRRGDDTTVQYITSRLEYEKLYERMIATRSVHIENLTWITIKILLRLKK
jgi:hypothetical protein